MPRILIKQAAKEADPSIDLPINLPLAVQALNTHGRVFEIFDAETEMLLFVGRAELLGLGKEAMFITRQSTIDCGT